VNLKVREITLCSMCFPEERESLKAVPLGGLYITSYLGENGINVDFRDYQLAEVEDIFDLDEMTEFCYAGSKDVIAFSCWENLLPYVVLIAERIKRRDKNKIIVLGGQGPTGVAKELLEAFPFIDFIVMGEGEITAFELFDALLEGRDPTDILGIAYRKGDEIIINPPRPFIKDLDTVPFPAYYKIDLDKYQRIHVITSRGCPYRCS